MAPRAHTLDTVKLLEDWEGWPAGTIAAVVAEHEETALVEVVADAEVDDRGLPTRDLLDGVIAVPYAALHVIQPARAHAR